MRVLVVSYGARGSVEPMVGLAVALRGLGAEVRFCAPPDEEFAELLAAVGLPVVPIGRPVRPMVASVTPGSAAGLAERAAELIAAQFGTVAEAAEGCEALVATGPLPVTAGARSVAEKLGIPYVHVAHQPVSTPSPHQPPPARRGRPLPPGISDNRELWDVDARNANEMFGAAVNAHRAAIGLPPLDNVRDYAFTDRPWLATDPTLSPWPSADADVVQTGAWTRPDVRPLPQGLEAFLDAGTPPVYVGFGSTPASVLKDVARVAVEAVRAQGRRVVVARGWAEVDLIDGGDDDCFAVGEVNQQALFPRMAAVVHHGSAGTTTTAARAGAPQVVVPQGADQPYWAERVVDLGIGAAHEGAAPTVASLSAALKVALAPETRERASAVAAAVRTDGAEVAARLVLEAIGREEPPASA
ncbi:glycosyltransferase [Streptomyces sp. RerS4]|uniref:glycosyltransferase n=1 Tax=Streptomyces sp. RerS4 TaxID=2942449 RepID=UPI00201C4536|nr:glycosyltransferase [Streptomyces sp. RerS4]UQX01939.1 glycosyltransferase [Streptomyces sp. RerS4]